MNIRRFGSLPPPSLSGGAALARGPRVAGAVGVVLGGLAMAAATGVGATVNARATFAALCTLLVGAAVLRNPSFILTILLASVFFETVALAGVAVGRVLGPIALILSVILLASGRARMPASPILWWVGAYAAWALASGLWTTSVSGTVFLLGSLVIAVGYMVAFAVTMRSQVQLGHVLVSVGVIGFLVSAFAIATFVLGTAGRASGGKGDPNSFAAFQVISLPLVLVAAAHAKRAMRVFLYLAALAIVVAVMTSLSRGALVTLLALIAIIAIVPSRAIFRSPLHKAVAVAVVVIGAVSAFYATSATFLPRLEEMLTYAGQSGSGRLGLWKASLTSIGERPILGLGYGAFRSNSNDLLLRTEGVDLVNFDLSPSGLFAHSTYLETFAELGLPGLLLFLGLLAATARELRSTARRAGTDAVLIRQSANALLFGLFAWSISAAFLSLETARPLWILIGMALALSALSRNDTDDRKEREKTLEQPPTGIDATRIPRG